MRAGDTCKPSGAGEARAAAAATGCSGGRWLFQLRCVCVYVCVFVFACVRLCVFFPPRLSLSLSLSLTHALTLSVRVCFLLCQYLRLQLLPEHGSGRACIAATRACISATSACMSCNKCMHKLQQITTQLNSQQTEQETTGHTTSKLQNDIQKLQLLRDEMQFSLVSRCRLYNDNAIQYIKSTIRIKSTICKIQYEFTDQRMAVNMIQSVVFCIQ